MLLLLCDWTAVIAVVSVAEESKKANTEPIRRKVINLQNDLKVETERAKASSEHKVNFLLLQISFKLGQCVCLPGFYFLKSLVLIFEKLNPSDNL